MENRSFPIRKLAQDLGPADAVVLTLSALNLVSPFFHEGDRSVGFGLNRMDELQFDFHSVNLVPIGGDFAGSYFRSRIGKLPPEQQVEILAGYLDVCLGVPDLTPRDYVEGVLEWRRDPGDDEASAATVPDRDEVRDVAEARKGDLAVEVVVDVESLGEAVRDSGSRNGLIWRSDHRLEDKLWLHFHYHGGTDRALDAFLSEGPDGRILRADYQSDGSSTLKTDYVFFESQRWVRVRTAPKVGLAS